MPRIRLGAVWFFLTIGFWLAACNPPPTPAAPTVTAVPPTATHLPAPATAAPTATPLPPTAAPTPDEAAWLADFAAALEDNLQNGRFQTISQQLATPFYISSYPDELNQDFPLAKAAVHIMQNFYLPPTLRRDMTVSKSARTEPLPEIEGAWWLDEPVTAVLPTSGWGPGGLSDGLIVLTEADGAYRWAGLILSRSGFAPPDWPIIPPPPGLVYRQGEAWRRVDADGATTLLLAHDSKLSLNPDATLALSGQIGRQAMTLFRLPGGESETVELGATLMSDTPYIVWLDGETAVLTLTGDNRIYQDTIGQLALLDAAGGQITILPPELTIYNQPSIGPEQAIILDVTQDGQLRTWQDGREQFTPIPAIGRGLSWLSNPALSPDGAKAAGITYGDFGPHSAAYVVADLAAPDYAVAHTFLPAGTDVALDWRIYWSPDSQWLAFAPPSFGLENSLWLVSADGRTKYNLGAGAGDPVWLDENRLVFTAVINKTPEIHLYDLKTSQRFRLDLPSGTRAVQFTPYP